MEAFLIGLFAIALGLGVTFLGYQLFRVIVPLWGFFVGFSWGAQALAIGMGTGFLATITGWIVGLVVGLVIGALAYFFYELAVVVLAGSVGYWLTMAFFTAIGMPAGIFATTLAFAAAIAFGLAAVFLKAPKLFIIIISAFAGATAVIGGILVMFGAVPVAAIGNDLVSAIISNSFLWTISWLILGGFGAMTQASVSNQMSESYYTSMNSPQSLTGAKGGSTKESEETEEPEVVETTETTEEKTTP